MTRVLYVTGWCRSGSTVLANLLNELPGVVHVGEVHYLWRNGVLREGTNTDCGCGQPVAECPLWAKVLADLGADPVDARRAVADQDAALRTRHTRRRLAERSTPAADRIVATYDAVARATDARLVVDSSKYPAEPAALLRRDDVDLRVLHLVRDPRASALSWVTPKAYIPAMPVGRSTAYWTGFNAASELIGRAAPDRYLRLRYEDFAADPAATLHRVIGFAGLDDDPPISDSGIAHLGANHTVTGNPDRLVHGDVTIRPAGDGWRTGLDRRQRAVITAIASPLLRRYGY